jgi:hypothetical protein
MTFDAASAWWGDRAVTAGDLVALVAGQFGAARSAKDKPA